jgi:hypothetical protein
MMRFLTRIIDKYTAVLVARLVDRLKVINGDFISYKYFDYWQSRGFHVSASHYYQPIPDTSKLIEKIFNNESELLGLDMRVGSQKQLLKKLKNFKNELLGFKKLDESVNDQTNPNFFFGNMAFDNVDALFYYGLIRHLKPKNIIEVGSGWSTKIAAQAVQKNKDTKLISIEPYPQPILKKGFNGLSELIEKPVQEVSKNIFKTLKSGDILFIDSSHTVKIGGDVNYLFFEILPILKKGVYVHVHDIFFPFDYPKDWVLKEHRFWTEQYMLQAFLMYSDVFEVVYSNSYMYHNHRKVVKNVFGSAPELHGGSFWMKKI